MTWKRGDQELKSHEMDALLEAVVGKISDKLNLEQVDWEAVKRSESTVRESIRTALEAIINENKISAAPTDKDRLIDQVYRETAGYGPITSFLNDKTVSEVMVNGPNKIFAERGGKIELSRRKFHSSEHLLHVIRLMTATIGRSIDEDTPYVDARIPDGSRIHAIIPPLSIQGPALTIRKFSRMASNMTDMVKLGAFTEEIGSFLQACIKGKLNVVVSGGTNTGKTTMLNALADCIDDSERLVTIEDACELQFQKSNLVQLETRPPNIEGKGEVTTRTLLRNALRMRPDRIIVGEVRGPESFDMLQAMNTGHSGSMTTVHANSTRDALARIETTALLADVGLPLSALRRQIAAAIHLVIHLERSPEGVRSVTKITEIIGMEGEILTTQDLFEVKYEKNPRDGSTIAALRPTGLIPKFDSLLEQRGFKIPRKVFENPGAKPGGVR